MLPLPDVDVLLESVEEVVEELTVQVRPPEVGDAERRRVRSWTEHLMRFFVLQRNNAVNLLKIIMSLVAGTNFNFLQWNVVKLLLMFLPTDFDAHEKPLLPLAPASLRLSTSPRDTVQSTPVPSLAPPLPPLSASRSVLIGWK